MMSCVFRGDVASSLRKMVKRPIVETKIAFST